MGITISADEVRTVYFPLTRCHETADSVKDRGRVSLLPVSPGDFGHCVGTGIQFPSTTNNVVVTSIERGAAARCDRASTETLSIRVGEVYPAGEFAIFAARYEAIAHARRIYGEAPDKRGCSWRDDKWVDW